MSTAAEMTQAAGTAAAAASRWRIWWSLAQGLLSTTSLVVVVALIALAYELQVGEHAGFGALSGLLPFAVGPYVIWTWTDPRARWWDELGAVALLTASVALSVVDLPQRGLKLGVGLVLILTEWRMVARWRERVRRADQLAAAAAQVAELQRQVAAAGWKAEEVAAALAAAERRLAAAEEPPRAAGPATASGGGAAWGRTKETQTEWLRRELAAGRNYTGEQVAELMGLGSAKTGRDRLAEARRPRLVTEETKEA